MNFWGFLISGVTSVFAWVLELLPLAQPNPLFESAPDIVAYGITTPYFWMAPLFDLRFFGIFLGLITLLEFVRAIIALWRWILSLIPAAS